MHAHLLGPLGVAAVPGNLGQAVADYRTARGNRETEFRCRVQRAAEATVLPSLCEFTRGLR
jgi:hypothetical protein